jgi:endonuclease/exonuclease/phosphatase family metal-dependent hydrolase
VARPQTLRFLTLNLWGENGPWEARMQVAARAVAALAPDVLALQEVREVPDRVPNQAATLAAAVGGHYVFAPSTAWGGGNEGLAIVSRFPIGAHGFRPLPHSTEKEGRIVLSARLDGDAGGLWVHSTHLSYRESEGNRREDQVMTIDEVVAAHANDEVQVVMGDFNATPDSDEIRWLCGRTTLGGRRVAYQDAYARANPGQRGITWAKANAYTRTMAWMELDRRLDYVFVTQRRRDGRGAVLDARVVLDEPEATAAGLLCASDHYGVLAEIQVAPGAPGSVLS